MAPFQGECRSAGLQVCLLFVYLKKEFVADNRISLTGLSATANHLARKSISFEIPDSLHQY
jgi:hypothetical protein